MKQKLYKFSCFGIGLYCLALCLIYFVSNMVISQCEKATDVKASAVFFSSQQSEFVPRLELALKAYLPTQEKIFLLGGARPQHERYGSEVMKQYLTMRGIPEKILITERASFDTYSNLEKLIHLNTSHLPTLLITDKYHLARISVILANNNPKFSYYFCTSSNQYSLLKQFMRLNYELLAWGMMLLPSEIRLFLIQKMRQTIE